MKNKTEFKTYAEEKEYVRVLNLWNSASVAQKAEFTDDWELFYGFHRADLSVKIREARV